ncbi:MAG: hypothetical protein L3J47_02240 [Sulfurovum sp.]|nr:hypothetical protein [Sulfurovum sp.]
MRMIAWAVVSAALLTACTNTEQEALLSQYQKNRHYHKQLLKTEKVQLYDGNLTKVALTATYLNPASSEQNATEDERFIIGLYMEDALEKSGHYDFNLSLNGEAPKEVLPLAHTDSRLKDLSFISEWNHYFLVTFPHISKNRFKLVFESETYGKGELDFAKKAKYIFSKKAF